jgi:hypothetical protein
LLLDHVRSSELEGEAEEAKRFDLLVLNLQLALLRSEPAFGRLRDQVKAIAGLLEEKSAIPMVRDQMPLIQDVQTDEWWQDVTVPMLESLRRRLRDLVKLIEKQKRKPIYTDFEDVMGAETDVDLPGFRPLMRITWLVRSLSIKPFRLLIAVMPSSSPVPYSTLETHFLFVCHTIVMEVLVGSCRYGP